MTQLNIIISKTGTIRHINPTSPEQPLQKFLDALPIDERRIRRASHVEPFSGLRPAAVAWLQARKSLTDLKPNDWYADLLPVHGPVLGPFPDSAAAVAAEIQWLIAHGIPIADSPGDTPDDVECLDERNTDA